MECTPYMLVFSEGGVADPAEAGTGSDQTLARDLLQSSDMFVFLSATGRTARFSKASLVDINHDAAQPCADADDALQSPMLVTIDAGGTDSLLSVHRQYFNRLSSDCNLCINVRAVALRAQTSHGHTKAKAKAASAAFKLEVAGVLVHMYTMQKKNAGRPKGSTGTRGNGTGAGSKRKRVRKDEKLDEDEDKQDEDGSDNEEQCSDVENIIDEDAGQDVEPDDADDGVAGMGCGVDVGDGLAESLAEEQRRVTVQVQGAVGAAGGETRIGIDDVAKFCDEAGDNGVLTEYEQQLHAAKTLLDNPKQPASDKPPAPVQPPAFKTNVLQSLMKHWIASIGLTAQALAEMQTAQATRDVGQDKEISLVLESKIKAGMQCVSPVFVQWSSVSNRMGRIVNLDPDSRTMIHDYFCLYVAVPWAQPRDLVAITICTKCSAPKQPSKGCIPHSEGVLF